MLSKRQERAIARFLGNIVIAPDGCWNWHGPRDKAGYGLAEARLLFGRRLKLAHQFSYALHVGPIPDGRELDHLAQQTHCQRGHEFNAANTYMRRTGQRTCRPCVYLRRGERKNEAQR